MWSGLVTVPGVDIFALQNWFFMRLLLPGLARRAWYVSRLFLKQPFFLLILKQRSRMGCGMWQGDVISHLTVIFCCGEKVITERRRSKGGVCACVSERSEVWRTSRERCDTIEPCVKVSFEEKCIARTLWLLTSYFDWLVLGEWTTRMGKNGKVECVCAVM